MITMTKTTTPLDMELFYRVLSRITNIPPEELKEKVRKAMNEVLVKTEIPERLGEIMNAVKHALDECEKLESLIRNNLDRDDAVYEIVLPALVNTVIPKLQIAEEALISILEGIRKYAISST